MFSIGYKKNEIVFHDDLCKKTSCGCMGGIRYSKKNNILVLFVKKNSQYENVWEGDLLKYMGSGKGNQSIYKQGNIKLAEATKNNTDIFLFEWLDMYQCRYIGRMILDNEPYYEMHQNKYGEMERKVIFPLKMLN
ncbi:hypothetical protein [Aristaeella lactis]|uniref:Uncharacterized protein n=1 Tax=Aristaeella lactis TaxID=3046383 RepID=A0AC61PL83_9FIRM|nr:hypothetical protein [Aristaeella lactis]QUA52188.1 hypothetical protein JYE50_10730 [Aristaeella lactis]SMC58550.1 hypothetical protein SAMN06297397_1567 [Aristaeella lactis]